MTHPSIRTMPAQGRPSRPVAAILLLLAAVVLPSCAHVGGASPSGGARSAGDGPALAASGVPPSDVASVPPHSGTIVYEAVQPDPSGLSRDVVLILYADRRALLLDRVVGDDARPLGEWEGSWSLSEAGSVMLSLAGKEGEVRLLLKRGEGYLTGDGSRFGGGVLTLREI